MKNTLAYLLFFLAGVTTTFCAESVLSFIEEPKCCEDHAQNFFFNLKRELTCYQSDPSNFQNPTSRTSFKIFVEQNLWHAWGIDSPEERHQGLRFLFLPPSDKSRMQKLEADLCQWLKINKHYHYLLSSLETILRRKIGVIASLRVDHPELFTRPST